jgi:hypothetical protein
LRRLPRNRLKLIIFIERRTAGSNASLKISAEFESSPPRQPRDTNLNGVAVTAPGPNEQ